MFPGIKTANTICESTFHFLLLSLDFQILAEVQNFSLNFPSAVLVKQKVSLVLLALLGCPQCSISLLSLVPSPLLPGKDPQVLQDPEQWKEGTVEEEKHALADLTTWHGISAEIENVLA
jgi:hypothetical protein